MQLEILGEEVHVLCGAYTETSMEFILEVEALRELVRLGTCALTEVDVDDD